MTNGRLMDNGRIWWIMYAMTRMAAVALVSALAMGCLGPAFTTAPDVVVVREPDPVTSDDAGSATAEPPAADAAVTKDTQSVPITDAAPWMPDGDALDPAQQSAVAKCLTTCAGCCDTSGVCNYGHYDSACGTRLSRADGMCVNCVELGTVCNGVQECMPPEAGTPACGPNNCTGCCDSSGHCTLGSDNTSCGQQGGSCSDCTGAGGVCSAGSCQAASTGCVASECPACTVGAAPVCMPTCKCCIDGVCL